MSNEKRGLYRLPEQGKIAGVCAGIGDRFGMEVWLVRVLVVSAAILTGFTGLIFLLYIAGWLVLDKKVMSQSEPVHVKGKVWQSGESPKRALGDIQQRNAQIEQRLRKLEQHVTSPGFQLKREIDRL